MTLVAWAPKKIWAPIELVAAKVPTGSVTKGQWLDSLASRVSEMAVAAGPEAVAAAARALDLPEPDEPEQAGQFFVTGNWNLQTHLSLAMDSNPFPAKVTPSEEAAQAIRETDLETWVDLAASMVSASSLD